jgi:hypothetical protein
MEAKMGCCWEEFLAELRKTHICLKDALHELKWEMNLIGGEYRVKIGYQCLLPYVWAKGDWWWTKLWKVRVPSKCILFMWLVLCNRVLMWELL